jgi:hypothetical protein
VSDAAEGDEPEPVPRPGSHVSWQAVAEFHRLQLAGPVLEPDALSRYFPAGIVERIVKGYVAGCIAISAWLTPPFVIVGSSFDSELASPTVAELFLLSPIFFVYVFLLVAIVCSLPALVLIASTEILMMRGLAPYLLIGGFPGLVFFASTMHFDWLTFLLLLLAPGSGVLAYWWIAGRFAGTWRLR